MTAQMNTIKKLFFSTTIALAVTAVTPTPWSVVGSVMAAGATAAIPPRLEVSVDPGKTIVQEIKVRNDSGISQLYTIKVRDFVVTDGVGTPIPVESSGSRWSLKSWVTAPDVMPVDANSTQIIRLTIKVPSTALPGGHYAMVTYQPHGDVKPGDLGLTSSVVAQEVGTLLYLNVNGPITEKAELKDFLTANFYEKGPVKFTGSVLNLSETHIAPKGTIKIYDPLNQKVDELSIEVGNVFPEANRLFSTVWNKTWGWGKYRADINLNYGKAGVLASTVSFWLFPVWMVIYALLAIVGVMTAAVLINKKNRKHEFELEKEVSELKEELKEVEKKD